MSYECELIHQESQPVVSIKTHTPVQELQNVLGKAFSELGKYLFEAGETPAGPPFVAYYNMDMQNLEIEVGFPVLKPLAGRGEVKPGEIPAGQYATCLHVGPYSAMEPAYTALTEWMSEHGHKPSGISYEYYLNEPEKTVPEDLQTRIVFPLV